SRSDAQAARHSAGLRLSLSRGDGVCSAAGHSVPVAMSPDGGYHGLRTTLLGSFRKSRCTLRQLLRLLARVVLRVDVGESPWTDGADSYNRFFVDEDIVRHAWRKGEETARG